MVDDSFVRALEEAVRPLGLKVKFLEKRTYRVENHFYNLHDNLYEQIEGGLESGEVSYDRAIFWGSRIDLDDISPDMPVKEIPAFVKWLEQGGFELDLEELTLGDLRHDYPDVYDFIYEKLSYDGYLEITGEDLWFLDINDSDVDSWFLEELGLCTVYYEVEEKDFHPMVAYQVGLIPFTFRGGHYLALGGAGMDLSPRLDAYQALANRTLPEGSKFITDPEYAKFLVGEDIYDQVMRAVTLDRPFYEVYLEEEKVHAAV